MTTPGCPTDPQVKPGISKIGSKICDAPYRILTFLRVVIRFSKYEKDIDLPRPKSNQLSHRESERKGMGIAKYIKNWCIMRWPKKRNGKKIHSGRLERTNSRLVTKEVR